jgi:hypothetical protein
LDLGITIPDICSPSPLLDLSPTISFHDIYARNNLWDTARNNPWDTPDWSVGEVRPDTSALMNLPSCTRAMTTEQTRMCFATRRFARILTRVCFLGQDQRGFPAAPSVIMSTMLRQVRNSGKRCLQIQAVEDRHEVLAVARVEVAGDELLASLTVGGKLFELDSAHVVPVPTAGLLHCQALLLHSFCLLAACGSPL